MSLRIQKDANEAARKPTFVPFCRRCRLRYADGDDGRCAVCRVARLPS